MKRTMLIVVAAAGLAGCVSAENAPLIFGQSQTLGISVGTDAAGAGATATVGFKDYNIAIIPTIATWPDGQPMLIQARVEGFDNVDAYSTFGQFEASTEGTKISLGKFFATGIAARRLADGFACEVSDGTDKHCIGGRPAS